MSTAEEILEQIKQLPPDERRKIEEALTRGLAEEGKKEVPPSRPGRYKSLLDLAGKFHSDHTDISTNKYEHVAAAALDGHGDTDNT
ncbi:hypothetical protein K8I61_19725 [bacterium]|nr:hypothetical protein [bacterium]